MIYKTVNEFIDYKKAYDLVPHIWVNERMEMFGIAENLKTFLQKRMQQWRLSLTANGEDLGEVNVKRRHSRETVYHHCCFC